MGMCWPYQTTWLYLPQKGRLKIKAVSLGSHLRYDNKHPKIYKGPFLHHILEYLEYKTKKERKKKQNKTKFAHSQWAEMPLLPRQSAYTVVVACHLAITLNSETSLKCSSLTEHIIQFSAKFQKSSFN